MGIGAAAFADDRNQITGQQGVSDIVPANDGPTMSAQDLYRAETAGYGIANMETSQMNKSDVGYLGASVGGGFLSLLTAAVDQFKPDADNENVIEEPAQKFTPAPQRDFTLG